MFARFVFKKKEELMKEISKEKNFFRMLAKSAELEGLLNYMNTNVQ